MRLILFVFLLILCKITWAKLLDFGPGNVLEYELDSTEQTIVKVQWLSKNFGNEYHVDGIIENTKSLHKRDGASSIIVQMYCAGYAKESSRLRSIIKRTADGSDCNIDGWTLYLIFYAFDVQMGLEFDTCVFGCGMSYWPHHRSLMVAAKTTQTPNIATAVTLDVQGMPTDFGAQQHPKFSDPVDIMHASDGYLRTLLNSLNDPLNYHVEPTLNGWSSSGDTFHSIMAIKYAVDDNFNHHVVNGDNHQMNLIKHHELRKRQLDNNDSNLTPPNRSLLRALISFVGVWRYDSISRAEVSGAYSIYGGNNGIRDQPVADFRSFYGSGRGSIPNINSVRIDSQSSIRSYPEYPGLAFANIQIQYGTLSYARVEIPVDMDIGYRRIRHAFIEALRRSPQSMRIIPNRDTDRTYNFQRMGDNTRRVDWAVYAIGAMIPLTNCATNR